MQITPIKSGAITTAHAVDMEHAILIKLAIKDTSSAPPPKNVDSHATVKQTVSVRH